jgi:hypothetical protein
VPAYINSNGSGRLPIPDEGCSDGSTWDPITGGCVQLKRMAKVVVTGPRATGSKAGNKATNHLWNIAFLPFLLTALL